MFIAIIYNSQSLEAAQKYNNLWIKIHNKWIKKM
jgi:hypothetical protein